MKTLAVLTSILFLAGCGSSTTINGSDIDPIGGNAGNPGNAGAAGIEETGGSGTGGNVATGGTVVETGGSSTGGNGEGGSVSTGGTETGGNNTGGAECNYNYDDVGTDCSLIPNQGSSGQYCEETGASTIWLNCSHYNFASTDVETATKTINSTNCLNVLCGHSLLQGGVYCCKEI